jgi:hypothetical protein
VLLSETGNFHFYLFGTLSENDRARPIEAVFTDSTHCIRYLIWMIYFEIYCYCDRTMGAVGNLSTWLLFPVFKFGILKGRACFVEINLLYLRGESREQIGRL